MAKARTKIRRVYVRRGHRRSSGKTLPIAVLAGFAPLAFGVLSAGKRAIAGDMAGASQEMVIRATGYNTDTKRFHADVFLGTYGPMLAGFVLHKLAGRLGINRALGQAGVPFIRI